MATFAPEKTIKAMKKTIIAIVAVSAVALVAVTLSGKRGQAADGEESAAAPDYSNIPLTEAQIQAVGLSTAPIEYRDMDQCVKANGQLVVRAQHTASVSSTMPGVVRRLLVSEGQKVGKGQLVATVENPEVVALQKDYYSACKEADYAKSELERQQYLKSQGAGLGKNLLQAEAQYNIAAARRGGIARQLAQFGISAKNAAAGKFTTAFPLRSPISGTVGKVSADIGGYVDMQTPLMSISDNSAVECDLRVFEKDLPKIRSGARVLLSLTNQGGKTIEGRVSGINEAFNSADKSVAVHVRLDKPEGELFGGMYVSGLISAGRERVEAVPSKAIVKDGDKTYVFVHNVNHSLAIKKTHHFARLEVRTGISEDGYTQVDFMEPVRKNLPVVTNSSYYLASSVDEHGEDH